MRARSIYACPLRRSLGRRQRADATTRKTRGERWNVGFCDETHYSLCFESIIALAVPCDANEERREESGGAKREAAAPHIWSGSVLAARRDDGARLGVCVNVE